MNHKPVYSRVIGVVLTLALALMLTGCGKRPKTVDAPEGAEGRPFPNAYPNPSLDPKPGQSSSGMKFP